MEKEKKVFKYDSSLSEVFIDPYTGEILSPEAKNAIAILVEN